MTVRLWVLRVVSRLQEFSRARWLAAGPIGIAAGIQSAAKPPSEWRFLGNLEQEAAGVAVVVASGLSCWRASVMDNTRCFANPFCDYKGWLLPAQSIRSVVPIVLASVDKVLRKVPLDCDGGLSDGPAGVAYMLYQASEGPLFSVQRDLYLRTAKRIIDRAVTCADAEPDRSLSARRGGDLRSGRHDRQVPGLGRVGHTAEQISEPVGGVRAPRGPGRRLDRSWGWRGAPGGGQIHRLDGTDTKIKQRPEGIY